MIRLRTVPALGAGLLLAGLLAACGATGPGRSAPSPAGPLTGDPSGWAFLGGASHYSATRLAGPRVAHVVWRRSLGGPIVAGPVVVGQVAYVPDDDGVLRALSTRTGATLWQASGGAAYGSDLSTGVDVLPSGEVLWPGPRGRVLAYTRTGRMLWSLDVGAQAVTPVLDPRDGELVIATTAGTIAGYRLTTGAPRLQWRRRLAGQSFGSPAVAADGEIYETAGDDLDALSASGRLSWRVVTPASVEVSPAIATDGIVVFGSNDRREWGVDPDGHVRWRVPIGNYTYSSPIALPGRRVIFGNHSGQMLLVNSDTGKLLRRDQSGGEVWTAPALDASGDVYFATRTGVIAGFSSAARPLFELRTATRYDSYPALAPGGRLLVGGDDGTLLALG